MGKSTTGLIRALRKMLSKNSNHLSAEDVEDLEAVIACLIKMRKLEKTKGKNPNQDDSFKKAIEIELVKTGGILLRFLLNPDVTKFIGDLLN